MLANHRSGKLFSLMIIAIFPLFLGWNSDNNNEICSQIIGNVSLSINGIETLSYTLSNTERIDGKLLNGKQFIKYNKSPFKCYIYLIKPNQGAELIFEENKNNNEAIYRPNGFPYIDLNLNPYGEIIKKNNHHTIFNIGFHYFGNVLINMFNKFPETFSYDGNITWNKISCSKITINNINFKFIPYQVKEGDNIRSIAKKNKVSEYLIKEKNSISENAEIKAGKTIQIPNSYAKTIELYIDNQTHLPVFQKISDEKGVFEQYEYYNIKINPIFKDEEFSKEILGKSANN